MVDLYRVAALVILAMLPASQVTAHHQLGLPHYLYSEEYPQIPTMVIDADAEGYKVTFSTYPGNPVPGETVRIKIYIRHAATDEVYTEPVEMWIEVDKFFGGEEIVLESRTVHSEYNEYKLTHVFEKAEKYNINLRFQPRDDYYETIPFPIVIGQTDFSIVPIAVFVLLAGIFVAVGLTKRKKKKVE